MFYKKLLLFLLFSFCLTGYFGNPTAAKASYCTPPTFSSDLFYPSDLVVAQVKEQKLNCDTYDTIVTFKNIMTIKGNVPDQFLVGPISLGDIQLCENPPQKPEVIIITDDVQIPRFSENKIYLMSIYPKESESGNLFGIIRPSCFGSTGGVASEVSGPFDPRVVIEILIVYLYPIWMFGFILFMAIAIELLNFIPDLLSAIISGIIVLSVYGFGIYLLVKLIRYLIRKIRKK